MSEIPRIAVVGCGAIAEKFHLPALSAHPEVMARVVLVDPTRDRALALAEASGAGGGIAADLEEVVDRIDGAVVTAPHSVHYSLCRALLDRGVHTLCEKPLTESLEEAQDLVERAAKAGTTLSVNQTRRLYPSHLRIRDLIRDGGLGAIRRVVAYEGEEFEWPAASGGYFGLASGGRGVILDRGAHQVDLLCWWFGEGILVRCLDDSLGGSEATASLEIRFGEIRAEVHLSWLARFPNQCTVMGEAGTVELGIYDQNRFRVTHPGRPPREERVAGSRTQMALGADLMGNFLQVVKGVAEPLVPAASVLPSIRILDACYRERARFPMPWLQHAGAPEVLDV